MKKIVILLLTIATVFLLSSCSSKPPDSNSSGYTIRIYSNSNSANRVTWLAEAASEAGFTVSIDNGDVISGDLAVLEAANENKDGDILFGLNETRWTQVLDGEYENLSILNWRPTWASDVEEYTYFRKAYGLVVQNVLPLYRTDSLGTDGKQLRFEHWSDMVDCGYTWYRPNKVGGTTNTNIVASILFPFVDPDSPAGGISVDGWRTLWRYCSEGKSGGEDYQYGFLPLNKGDVQVSAYYSSSLYGQIGEAAESSSNPLRGTLQPENWALVDIADGTYYIAEYIGILDKEGRSEAETEIVTAFAEWFGSAETQAAWGEQFDTYPCNQKAANILYPNGIPSIYTLPNLALDEAGDTGMTYATYVASYVDEWINIMTNLGFFWLDESDAPAEPDWDHLDWSTLIQSVK